MLTPADRALWQQFLKAMEHTRPQFEADDMLPVVLVFARVERRADDFAEVGLGPGEIALLTRPGIVGHDLVALFEAAATVARKQEAG